MGLRERPARGAKSVAVERGAEVLAVGEGDGGRSVPRLHQGGVVFAEAAHVVPHRVACAPRLGQEHEHRVRRVASGGDEKLEHVVERGGVGLAGRDERQDRLDRLSESRRGERRLARGKGVEVALQGVDFAVVRQRAEGVRESPRREGVRRVALVDDHEGGGEERIGEIRVEPFHLRRQQQSLVDDRARGHRADVAVLKLFLDGAADDVEAAFEGVVVVWFGVFETVGMRVAGRQGTGGLADHQLPDARHGRARQRADRRRIDGNVAPGDQPAAVLLDGSDEHRLFADGVEEHRHAVFAFGRKFGKRRAEERIGNPREDAGPVAGLGIVAGRAAVHEALEDGETVGNDLVARRAVQIGDQPHATGVVFIFVTVQPLLPILHCRVLHASFLVSLCAARANTVPVGIGRAAALTSCSGCNDRRESNYRECKAERKRRLAVPCLSRWHGIC